MKNSKNVSIILLILILALACNKEGDILPYETSKWQIFPSLSNEGSIMNGAFFHDEFIIISTDNFIRNLTVDSLETEPNYFRLGSYTGSGRLKFPLSQNYYIITDLNKIIVRSALSDENQSSEKIIDMKSIDNDFARFIDIPYWQGECVSINEDDYILLSYETENNGIGFSPNFILAKIVPPTNSNDQLEISEVKFIKNDFLPGSTSVYSISSYFSYFFAVCGANTFRIDTEGNIILVSQSSLNIFQKDELLYAFAANNNSGYVDFYESIDKGENWVFTGEIAQPSLFSFHYVLIKDHIIGYYGNQLFNIELAENNYTIRELDNEGLGQDDITSISFNNDNTVVLTSTCKGQSQSCGVFYKPMDDFLK